MPAKKRMVGRTNLNLDQDTREDIEFLEYLYHQPAAEIIRRAVKRLARKERINNPSVFDVFTQTREQGKP